MRGILLELNEVKTAGKTYSLFGNSENTDDYYDRISIIADELLIEEPDIMQLISKIKVLTSNRSKFKRCLSDEKSNFLSKFYRSVMMPELSQYTKYTADHLKELSVLKRIRDKRLSTVEEEYHFYMLKIELVNRLNKNEFNKCGHKIALLPHCLKDLSKKCKSEADEFDYVCKGCSKQCFLNAISSLLRKFDIAPYIWMKADIKKLFKESNRKRKTLGVIGIACIPEVENGMNKCIQAGIPVLGLPLNANRCGRWFGEFHPNSINLSRLEKLIDS